MTPHQAIAFFGSQEKVAQALGIGQSAVSQWVVKRESIPPLSQLRLEEVTRGALKADPDVPRGWCRPEEQQAAA